MRKMHTLIGAIVALGLVIAAATFDAPFSSGPDSAGQISAPAPAQSARAELPGEWTAPIWTGGARNARQHWDKHGREFPEFADYQDYVDGVHAFLLRPPEGTLVKHRSNGDTLYFHPGRGIFAVQAASGAPRTFFRPDDGLRYWERQ